MRVSIIIAIRNDQDALRAWIRKGRAVDLPDGIEREIVAVDDGSVDGSTAILAEEAHAGDLLVLRHPVSQGRGAAFRTGAIHATGDILLVPDPNVEYDPGDYARLIAPIADGSQEIVYGNALLSSPRSTPFRRELSTRLVTLTTRLLYGAVLWDVKACPGAWRAEVVTSIPLCSRGSGFGPELTAKILKRGYHILEVPVCHRGHDFHGGTGVDYRDTLVALWTLLKYRLVD